MFLIDNDQAEIIKGQKQSRARSNNDLGLAIQRKSPRLAFAAFANIGMPFNRHIPKSGGKTVAPRRG